MLRIRIANTEEQREFVHGEGFLEIGRGPGATDQARCCLIDRYVSREHLLLRELPGGRVWLKNQSSRNHVMIVGQAPLEAGAAGEVSIPVRLTIGQTEVEIAAASPSDERRSHPLVGDPGKGRSKIPTLAALNEPTLGILAGIDAPGSSDFDGVTERTFVGMRDRLTPARLLQWVESLIAVQRAAPGSAEFYQETARTLVDIVGLDRGLVLVAEKGDWRIVARHEKRGIRHFAEFSRRVVQSVVEQKRTLYQVFEQTSDRSLVDIDAVVASPILDEHEKVVGIIYGSHSEAIGLDTPPLGRIDAQVVQLLATTVSASLSRARKDEEVRQTRRRFEQFFSQELALELERNPNLLEGQEREVTLLFLDIRGFSRLTQRLNPRDSYRLAQDFMDPATERILERHGMVVDYAGDGLLAMWNAPADQPMHAAFACQAALEIASEVPRLKEQWQQVAGGILEIGIGINTGTSLVGNAGSRTKLKYGPRGHTVNLGSRIEGATRHLDVPILVAGSTKNLLAKEEAEGAFHFRRLCRARLAGISEAVDLYDIQGADPPADWLALRDAYERALFHFESGQWPKVDEAFAALGPNPLVGSDEPTRFLRLRALECIQQPPMEFDGTIEFKAK